MRASISLPRTCRAVVANKGRVRIESVDVPRKLRGGALVQVEAAAVCGSDWGHLTDDAFFDRGRVVLGHENVGRLIAVDDDGPAEPLLGQRVVVEEFVPCGRCAACRHGLGHACPTTDFRRAGALRYGRTPVDTWPGLWGGFAELMYVHPATAVHPIAEDLPAEVAAFATPVANGLRWLRDVAGLRPGESVLVVGPGAHGLGCVLAARAAGAGTVICAGTERDGARLADAERLGADRTVAATTSLVEGVAEALGGGADVVIDLTPGAPTVLEEAIELASPGGRIVAAGHKQGRTSAISSDKILAKEIALLGVRGSSTSSMAAAVDVLTRHRERVAALDVMRLPLTRVEQGLRTVGRVEDRDASRVVICPQQET